MNKPSFDDGTLAPSEEEMDAANEEIYDTGRFDQESTPEEYFARTSKADDDEDDVDEADDDTSRAR